MEELIEEQSNYFEYTKYIIDPNIHRFLYVLVKYFFFKRTYMESSQEKLQRIIRILRRNGLNLDINCLENKKCDTASLEAILKFIQTQNFALASEIFENIIIRVLSFAFVTRNDEFFGKYLYNNLDEFKMNKQIFLEWIDTRLLESLFNETNKDLLYALDNDISLKQLEKKSQAILCKESTFLKIIYRIIKTKIFIDNSTENSSSDSTTSTVLGDYTSIYSQLSELYFGSNFGLKNNYSQLFPISFSILISSYIYHQNRKSPFMKYIDNVNQTNSDLVDLPFSFVISEGGINDIHSSIILSPIRMEPRITNIELNKNRIDIYGIFELHKVLLFNKNIKTISIQSCAVKSKSLNTFHDHYTIYNNNNVEKLYMSSNYLKSDADSNLSNLLIHLKELKYLSLSNNTFKSGLGYFFVTLKNLYRKNQTKLEELNLTNCELDDISFYELGELLKSKYCKLKCLCLNENIIPSDINFFKALKKNRSLEEIYFYGCGINSEKTDEVERLINNTNLQSLYLYTNKIHDFNQYLRIIYKTTLIKTEKEKNKNIFISNPVLYNLNMNNVDCFNQNKEKLDILLEGLKKTNLTSIDLSSVLKDARSPDYKINYKYYKAVNKIIEYLSKNHEEYKNALKENLELDPSNNKYNNENFIFENFREFESDINNIINDPKSIYSAYIHEQLNDLISKLDISEKEKKEKMEKLSNYILMRRDKISFDKNEKIIKAKKIILI